MNKIPYSQEFEKFWKSYPRKIDKTLAWEAWKKLDPDEEDISLIMEGVEKWKKSETWNQGYIIYAERFLKRRKWEDDVESMDISNTFTI